MASRRVEEYAHQYGLSNRQAKRRMGGHKNEMHIETIARGAAVKGTGKKGKGVKKGAGGS
jgi:hypothetical protein